MLRLKAEEKDFVKYEIFWRALDDRGIIDFHLMVSNKPGQKKIGIGDNPLLALTAITIQYVRTLLFYLLSFLMPRPP